MFANKLNTTTRQKAKKRMKFCLLNDFTNNEFINIQQLINDITTLSIGTASRVLAVNKNINMLIANNEILLYRIKYGGFNITLLRLGLFISKI